MSYLDSPTPDFFKPRPDARVAVGCRFHDPARTDFLARAVNSILAMTDVDVRCIVACQHFSDRELDLVSSALAPYEDIHRAAVTIVNVELPEPIDARALLLNRIIDHAATNELADYLMFVDYDDVVFAHAAAVLVNSLEHSGCDFAYGNVLDADEILTATTRFTRQIRDLHGIDRKFRPDLFDDNFLPLHSYMFRLSALVESGVRYDESLPRLEDYDLLLRFLTDRPASPLSQKILIGLYNFYHRSGSSNINTTCNPFTPGSVDDEAWAEAGATIRTKMASRRVFSFASDHPMGGG